jgi:hypothetical protein
MYKKVIIAVTVLLSTSAFAQKSTFVSNQSLQTACIQLERWFKYWVPTDAKAPFVSLIIQRQVCGIADADTYLETVASDLRSRRIVFQAFYDFTQGKRDYLFLNLKDLGLTAVNAKTITDYIIDSHNKIDPTSNLSEKERTQKNLAEGKVIKLKLLSDYNKTIEDIISGREPLKHYNVNLNSGNEDYGIPTTIQYNANGLKYNLDKALLLNLLDSINNGRRFYFRFDRVGKFKTLLNEEHQPINLSNSVMASFQNSISLVKPISILYNQKSFNVEFETKQFYLDRSDDFIFTQFAFSPTKKDINFLDTSFIDATFNKDPKFKPSNIVKEDDNYYSSSYSVKKVALDNSQESKDFLSRIIYPTVSKIDNNNGYGYDNMVTSAQFLFYRYHFKIKNGVLQYAAPGVIYVATVKNPILKTASLEENNGKVIELTSKTSFYKKGEQLNKIYVYNWLVKEVE